jgi:hypothetical protein
MCTYIWKTVDPVGFDPLGGGITPKDLIPLGQGHYEGFGHLGAGAQ